MPCRNRHRFLKTIAVVGLLRSLADRGEITGEFTIDEVKDLAAALNGGAMPARLTLLEKRTGRAAAER